MRQQNKLGAIRAIRVICGKAIDSPGCSARVDQDSIKTYLEKATTDPKRDLLRPPYVGKRSPLKIPESGESAFNRQDARTTHYQRP